MRLHSPGNVVARRVTRMELETLAEILPVLDPLLPAPALPASAQHLDRHPPERSRGSSRWKPGPGISGELPGGALPAGSRDHTKVPGRRADTSPDMACGAVRDRPTGKTGAGRIVLPVPRKGKPVATRGRKASALPRVPRAGRTAAEGRHADMPLTFARLPLRHFSSITLRRFMTSQELVQQEKLMRLSERCVAEIHRTKNEDIRSTLTMALTAINEAWFHLETKTENRVPQS